MAGRPQVGFRPRRPDFFPQRHRAIGAEPALARHAQPRIAPDVIQVGRAARGDRLEHPVTRDQLALTDQVAIAVIGLDLRQRLAES